MLSPDTSGTSMEHRDKTREELTKRIDSLRDRIDRQEEEIARCGEMERSLRESEEKYRFLVENSKDIIWKIDMQGRWTFVSGNVEKILGYRPEEVVGRTIWDFIVPEHHARIAEILRRRLRGEEIPPYEVDILTKDGRRVPFEALTTSIVDKGKVVGVQGISRDIVYRKEAEARLKKYHEELEARVRERTSELTEANRLLQKEINERKAIEDSMRESEEKFRVLAETSAAAIFVYQGTHFISVNQAAVRITGYSKDELFAMDILDIVHPAFRKMVYERSQARQRGEPAPSRYEFKIITKSGDEKWIEMTAGRILYKGRPAGVATLFDITERKRAEEKARLTQFAIDNFTDESIWLNTEGSIVYVNKATCDALGYSADELLSMKIWDIDPEYPYERYRERWNDTKEKGAITFESAHFTKDGRAIPVEISAIYLRFEDKEYSVTFSRDITLRKQAEEAISDARAQAELYLDLMSHDINNINQIALGYLELADNVIEAGGKLGKDDRELIDRPVASLRNSSKLIEKVMKLRKLQAEELKLEPIDVCDVVNRVKGRYAHVTGRDITINYILPRECLVMANELLEEIFINLIENSLKHSPPSRPLVINIIHTEVCEDGREYNRILIEDNGPGIPDEVKKNLFARYYRGEARTKGKGLGLFLVRMLVEDFHGKVWVEDRVPGDYSKGAKFVVMLPAASSLTPAGPGYLEQPGVYGHDSSDLR